jgi:RNA polymerase sigma factor for flagellar operon FliA
MNKQTQNELVQEHLNLVKIIALKIFSRIPPGIELGDLIHTGVIGLINAASKFDHDKGTKFSTYASLRIRGAILDELRGLDWASRNLRKKIKDMEKAFAMLEKKMGRPPKEEEVAESLELSLCEFQKLLDDSRGIGIGVFRFSAKWESSFTDDSLLKYYFDEETESPEIFLEKNEMKRMIQLFMDELPEKKKLVLSLYYIDDLNLKEIGKILKLTESRISQIRTTAILRLRAKISETAKKNKVNNKHVF